jgi:aminopeptidase N
MQESRRLTHHFNPQHYNLSLQIQRTERTFSGTVSIQGAAISKDSIWLHSKDLTITTCLVNGSEVPYTLGQNDELEVHASARTDEKYILTLGFSGKITDQMHGMYPCYYNEEGVAKELIATQFESHHAREVFPCIDEPEAKATFDVTLTTEKGVVVLGNMPIQHQHEEKGLLVTSFDTTPRMSSYLLAWVCGDLQKKTAHTKSGVEVNIWSTPAQPLTSLDFALDIATRTIDFFDDYFGTPYPLPKCDHVALPDFSSGAMENWGLITYREVALLAEPGSVSVSSKHRIAAVIAHELSHQWFGNLVTMKWWNNLWLNESFANLMEYVAIDALEPSWNVWHEFAGYETVMSLRRDATDGVQAVQVDVHHPDEISTLFDPAIVYAKGSRLLHMLERYLGEETFRDGLRLYFKAHAYKSTSETDLWKCLGETSGKDIPGLMTPWISQPGYPVVHVKPSGLAQEQFFIGDHAASSRIWPIPLNSGSPELPNILATAQVSLDVPCDTRLNVGDSAHFITHYDEDMLANHLQSVTDGTADPVSRLQLLHEQTLLARGRIIHSAKLLPIVESYRNEKTESVWDIMALAVGEQKKFVEDDSRAESSLRKYAGALARPQFERLGWESKKDEPESDTKLRSTIISMMMYSENNEIIRHAKELASGSVNTLDPELRSLILGCAVKYASDDQLFNMLLEIHGHTASAELQQDIASALTSTRDNSQIETLLRNLKQPRIIRSQDVARWFVYLMRNRYSRAAAWDWMRDNWDWIEKTFAGDKSYDEYPRYAASGLSSRKQLSEYETFFTPLKSQRSLERVITMGISEIKARVDLIEEDGPEVRETLLNKY